MGISRRGLGMCRECRAYQTGGTIETIGGEIEVFFRCFHSLSEARMGNSIEQKKEDDKLRLESERFHQRRSYLIDHYKYMTKMRGLKISLR